MAFTVHIENFQSIKDATITVDGFTVISGRNNSGKTAVMRAILGVFTNPPIGALLRHGADKLVVEIRFDDGEWVRWEKNAKGKTIYVVNGIELQNVGRSVPPEVLAVGIWPIMAGSAKVWPQVAPQFTGPVFLLDLPGSALAEAISDVERVGQLNRGLRAAQSDLRSSQDTLKVRRKDLKLTEEKLAQFEGLEDVGHTLAQLVEKKKRIAKLAKDIADLQDLLSRRNESKTIVDHLDGVQDIKLPDPQKLARAKKAGSLAKTLTKYQERRQKAQEQVTWLSEAPLDKLPKRSRLEAAVKAHADLVWCRTRRTKHEDVSALLGAWGDQDPESLLVPVASQSREASQVREELASYLVLQQSFESAGDSVLTLTSELEAAQKSFQEAHDEKHEILGTMGDCPTCGTEIRS